jgi:acyl transferase domain-containing protein/aryl carrier-like protein
MNRRKKQNGNPKTEPIAIIGIGCRFPGASGPDAFWQLLCDGIDAIGEIPPDRFDLDAVYDPRPGTPGKICTRWGGFLQQVDQFDPYFFGISPREAARMDPQQRLLLEVAWEALEDAGQAPEKLAGSRTGVFIGLCSSDYGEIQSRDPAGIDIYVSTGSAHSVMSGRVSFAFGLKGPSVVIDTACSSSLVAVHLACQSLRSGESKMALAGGVNLILLPEPSIGFSQAKMLAPDGRCKAFDARADGFVRSDGVGVVVLKPLSQAQAEGDPVYAVIRGSAVNNDGRDNGLMTPSRKGQEAVLREAYRNAGLWPSQVDYVEAHGTGTSVGDPIEAQALGAVLSQGRPKHRPCVIGSVKTNIGHTEAAAGIAGLIKVALCLKHRAIPPSLHFQEPNPTIPWDDLPLIVQRELGPWPKDFEPAVAGVSSFGISGTNAHVVLQALQGFTEREQGSRGVQRQKSRIQGSGTRDQGSEFEISNVRCEISKNPDPCSLTPDPSFCDSASLLAFTSLPPRICEPAPLSRACLLPLSAHTPEGLRDLVRKSQTCLASDDWRATHSLHDVCYTASVRRTHHDHRLAVVGRSWDEVAEHLEAFLQGETRQGVSPGQRQANRRRKLVFIFPGQGSQWLGMGRELLEQEPVFRQTLGRCDQAMRQSVEWSLLKELTAGDSQSRLNEIDVIQPALFAIQVALAAVWRSWGIGPDAVVGQSMGEVAAAHVAGALSLDDAARIICRRSRLLKQVSGQGGMAAVELSLEQAQRALAGYEDRLSIAVSNSPTSTVLSGDPAALQEVIERLQQQNVFCRLVKVDIASHSPQMEPLRDQLHQALEDLKPQPASVPIYSTVTGTVSTGLLDANYWWRNLREPVLFSTAVEQLLDSGHDIFLELSPHPILLSAVQQGLYRLGKEGTVLPSLRREEDERATMLGSLGALYTLGMTIDWSLSYPNGGGCVSLPSHPWQRERFWFESRPTSRHHLHRRRSVSGHPLLGPCFKPATQPGTHVWEMELSAELFPYLDDHRVQGLAVLPAAAYIEMALAAANEAFGAGPHVLEEVAFKKALFLPGNDAQTVQLIISPDRLGTVSFQFFSLRRGAHAESSWSLHASGTMRLGQHDQIAPGQERPSVEEIQARCAEMIPGAEHYQAMERRGLHYGPSFQSVERIWRQDGEALGRLRLSEAVESGREAYHIHPALLDACFQVLAATVSQADVRLAGGDTYLPVGLGGFRVNGQWAEAKEQEAEGGSQRAEERDRPSASWPLPSVLWSHAALHTGVTEDTFAGDVFLLDEQSRVMAEARGFRFQRLERDAKHENVNNWLYEIQWRPKAHPQRESFVGFPSSSQSEPEKAAVGFPSSSQSEPEKAAHGLQRSQMFIASAPGPTSQLRQERHATSDGVQQVEGDHPNYKHAVPSGTFQRRSESGLWLIFSDRQGVGQRLTSLLEERGENCVVVFPGAAYQIEAPGRYRLNPACAEDFQQLVQDVFGPGQPPGHGVVHLWGLDTAPPGRWHTGSVPRAVASVPGAPDARYRSRYCPNVVWSDLEAAQGLGCFSVLHLIQALTKHANGSLGESENARTEETKHEVTSNTLSSSSPLPFPTLPAFPRHPSLWLVTRGAQAVGPSAESVSVAQSPLWGLGRVIANEHPEFRCTMIDLDPSCPLDEAGSLVEEFWSGDGENQIAWRGDARYVARLVRRSLEVKPSALSPQPSAVKRQLTHNGQRTTDNGQKVSAFRLEIPEPGILDNLALRATTRHQPGPGAVEIEICAAGLNFSDVMKALGMYPGLPDGPVPLGIECAGRIAAVGAGVQEFQIGDEVIAIAPYPASCFGAYVTILAGFVMAKPAHLSFDEASTIPVAFGTAYYALNYLGRISGGERVLIHAAAGSVGLAAIQLAQRAGAEVLATAGSPEKREFLRSLGVEHVMDSRSLTFADEIMEVTHGQGVDLVLNSLAGEAIARSLSTLRPFGRFIEIGKRDIYQNSPLGLHPFRNNLSFFALDMDQMMRERPALVQSVLREVVQLFVGGGPEEETGGWRTEEGQSRFRTKTYSPVLHPLPRRVFPVSEAVDAFRFMAQAKHIGKIVVSLQHQQGLSIDDHAMIRSDATYLITGGLGGLGLSVAEWVVRQGARHLVLIGRSGASSTAEQAVDAMRQAGAEVRVARADVSQADQVARVLAEIRQTMPPLRGIVHAAGVLDDGILLQLNQGRLASVMSPKIGGAWNLHSQTLDAPLDFFVLFSSAASVFGSPGQGNYAAANAFLDALAQHRRALGLPALAVNWGPWAEVGLAARPDRSQRLTRQGMISFTPKQGVQVMERLLPLDAAQVMALSVDWPKLLGSFPAGRPPALLSDLIEETSLASARSKAHHEKGGLTREMLLAAEPEQRQPMMESFLQEQLARVLGLAPSRLDRQRSLMSLGLDSLMAVELKNRIEAHLGVLLPVASLLQGPNVTELAAELLAQLTASSDGGGLERIDRVLDEVDRLSGDTANVLLDHTEPIEGGVVAIH